MDPLLRFGVPERHQSPLLGVGHFDASVWKAVLSVLEAGVSDHASTVDRLMEAGLSDREADRFFEAAVIVHALRVNTFNRMTNERESVEIGMTATDIADLKKALDRAEKKDKEMQHMLDQLALRRIDAGRLL